jgi:parvulin-like peptidyl-prolyl isomerase
MRFVLPLFVCLGALGSAEVRVVEEIVAKVNGDIITRGELERQRRSLEAELRQQGVTGPKLEELLKQRQEDVLRDQIDQLLLVQRARDINVTVDPEVTKRMAEIQLQSKIADPDKFQAWVREQAGMAYEDFRDHMKKQMLTQRVIGMEVTSRITIPEAEKRAYYEQHKEEFIRQEEVYLREILISTEGKDEAGIAAAEKKAKDLVARARRGEKFYELARDNSDAATAKNFGELGWWQRKDLNPEIAKIVFSEKKNYVTDPVKVPNGFIILKVEDRHEAGQAAYEDVENEITEKLAMPKMQPAVREFLTKLRHDAFLEIRDGYADSGAAPGKDTSWKDPAQLKPETITKEEVAAQKKRRLLWIIPLPGGGDKNNEEGTENRPAETAPEVPAPPAAAAKP